MTTKAWDIRLARLLVRPLRHTPVTPNHLTTLSLIAGLGAGVLYATGDRTAAGWAALCFMLAALIDHADGELARMADKCSQTGYYYDHITGALIHIALFLGIGIGLRHGPLGNWALLLGFAAGISVSAIFALRFEMERRFGRNISQQPNFAGFEIEDIMYLIGPITWAGGLHRFLVAAGIGAPVFGLWLLWQYLRSTPPTDARGEQP